MGEYNEDLTTKYPRTSSLELCYVALVGSVGRQCCSIS